MLCIFTTANTSILSINHSGSFELSANATATATSASLTFTDRDGNSFVQLCSTANTDATDTHVPKYSSVPQGFPPNHFRSYREDSLGARRRTYEGTINTENTSVDFGLPFEVFDINVNTITVGTTTPTNVINTGTTSTGTFRGDGGDLIGV